MFFEESEINSIINCYKCQERLDDPRILPCGDTVCSRCVATIHVNNGQFDCLICDKKHLMDEHGLMVNKMALNLLSKQPKEVYRSRLVELLKDKLSEIRNKITSISFGINNSVDTINEYCKELRSDVQLATEEAIQQLNEHSDQLILQIENYENESIQSCQLNINDERKKGANKNVKELEMFHYEWTNYLKQTKISDDEISSAYNQGFQLNEKAEQEQLNLNSLIFDGAMLKFERNSKRLDKSLLGLITLKGVTGVTDSFILSNQQLAHLIRLCEFSLKQKWELVYRASKDGFSAANFHSKCDSKSNTLVIIKSDNEKVFGGYTEQTWSGNRVFKSDLNTFVFSFINEDNKPLLMKCQLPDQAILADLNWGPIFGSYGTNKDGNPFKHQLDSNGYGCDFEICDNSNSKNESKSNLGGSYKHPKYFQWSNEAQTFLAGSHRFKTIEIEIYSKI